MSGLSFNVDKATIPDKPLNDPNIQVNLAKATVGYDGTQNLQGIKFSFGVSTIAAVEAYNSPDDKDADGIIGPAPKENGLDSEPKLPPQIIQTNGHAWLKYRYEVEPKVSASGSFPPVSFKVDGDFKAVFTDFHVHQPDEKALDAVKSDELKVRFAATLNDILDLRQFEALSYRVTGELGASVTLSWSDIFTSNLASLTKFLSIGKMLALNVTVGASATLSVRVVDDFNVVFTRFEDQKIKVAVNKAKSRQIGAAAALQVKASFSDPSQVKQVLNNVVKALMGQSLDQIDNILGKATLSDLSPDEKAIANSLAQQLGLGALTDDLTQLKNNWDSFKKSLSDATEAIATAKVEAGFTYEYTRIKTDDALLEVAIYDAELKKYHNDLMLCNLNSVLNSVTTGESTLISYLHQTTLESKQAWGFSLNLGSWVKIGGKDQKNLKKVVQEDMAGNQRIAYNGVRQYTGQLGKWKEDWTSDFKADMANFASGGVPTACDFNFGLDLRVEYDEKLNEESLKNHFDWAVVWRAVAPGNFDKVKQEISAKYGQWAKMVVEIKFDDTVLRKLLEYFAAMGDDAINALGAHALAKALPYVSEYAVRTEPKYREICYAPLWDYYLQNPRQDPMQYALTAGNTVEKIALIDHLSQGLELGSFERGQMNPGLGYKDMNTFAGQIYIEGDPISGDYSSIYRDFNHFKNALRLLQKSLTPGNCAPYKTIETVFGELSNFLGQSFYVRTAGILLMDLAASDASLLAKINRVFTIQVGDQSAIFSVSVGG